MREEEQQSESRELQQLDLECALMRLPLSKCSDALIDCFILAYARRTRVSLGCVASHFSSHEDAAQCYLSLTMPVDLQLLGEEVALLETPEGRFFLASQLAKLLKVSDNTINNWCGDRVIVSRDSDVLKAFK